MMKRKRWLFWAILAALAGIYFVFVAPVMVICTDYAYICENTGSRRGHREWYGGIKTGEWYRASEVEKFILKNYPQELKHRWTCYAGTQRNIYGAKLARRHGRPGPLIQLHEEWLNEWFTQVSDAEKKAFYELLVADSRDAINSKVNSILSELLERHSN